MKRYWAIAAVASAATALSPVAAYSSPVTVSGQTTVTATVNLNVDGLVCDNAGTQIQLSGSVTYIGAQVNLWFANQQSYYDAQHTGKASAALTTTVDLPSQQIDKNGNPPVVHGPGGNPWIYVQLPGQDTPTLLGKCVQGARLGAVSAPTATVEQIVAILSAANIDKSGPTITIDATGGAPAITATVWFTNNRAKFEADQDWKHAVSGQDVSVVVTLAPAIEISKGAHWDLGNGFAGGNPWIWITFGTVNGNATPCSGDPNTRISQLMH